MSLNLWLLTTLAYRQTETSEKQQTSDFRTRPPYGPNENKRSSLIRYYLYFLFLWSGEQRIVKKNVFSMSIIFLYSVFLIKKYFHLLSTYNTTGKGNKPTSKQ